MHEIGVDRSAAALDDPVRRPRLLVIGLGIVVLTVAVATGVATRWTDLRGAFVPP